MARLHELLAVAAALGLAGPAAAVLIDSVDGLGNTTAPLDDPGWEYVGVRGGTTVVYLGLGWVVTANHVQLGDVLLDGTLWPAVPGSKLRLAAQNGEAQAPDLAVFRLDPYPDLPLLPIRSHAPVPGEAAVLIGNGKNRGAPTQWDPGTGPIAGYEWGTGKTLRWGTNVVADLYPALSVGQTLTDAFATAFRSGIGPDEAAAANGDSGGAVFLPDSGGWALGGILFAVDTYPGQPGSTSLYGNLTYAADLSVYRAQLIALTRTECSNEIDDDGDLAIDHPDDPGCIGVADDSEEIDCSDGFDNDGDGLADFPEDPGCDDALDGSERSPVLPCDDGIDNDGDGVRDHPDDPGCRDAGWHNESPACDDGLDNDGDGQVDLEDADCTDAWQTRERPPTCGLGPELLPLSALLALPALRRRLVQRR